LRMLRADHPSLTLKLLKEFLATPELATKLEAVRTLRESPYIERREVLAGLARDRSLPTSLRSEAIVGLAPEDDATRELLVDLAAEKNAAVQHESLRSMRGVVLSDRERAQIVRNAQADEAARELAGRVLGKDNGSTLPPNHDRDAWMKLLDGPADAAEGERVFFHPKGPGCYRCHQVDGRGGRAGPDLSATGQALSRERLVESILEPSKEIAPQFVTWLIAKTDGSVATGMLLEESALGDQTYAGDKGTVFALKAADIESRRAQSVSIMPDDLVRLMTVQEFRDLIAYLQKPRAGEVGAPRTEPAER
jgi:putative heme-binding domain-containing protein